MSMGKLEFCRNFVRLSGSLMDFTDRPYLPALYAVDRGNVVVRASRQVEKSTFLANTIFYECCRNPGAQILFVAPREDQAESFFHDRLQPPLMDSRLLRRALLGKGHSLRVKNIKFSNGSCVKLRPAFHNADACRGISANLLFIDEVQDIAPKSLAVLRETLSHAADKRIFLTGTPKLIDNELENVFSRSTANLWTIPCTKCDNQVTIDERCLAPEGLVCPRCSSRIDVARGRWVPTNPHSTWGTGYSISHPMVPWIQHHEVYERMQEYDLFQFRNEVLGLPTTLGEHLVTMAELEACCQPEPMWKADKGTIPPRHGNLIAGVDWGGGSNSRTVLVVGEMSPDFVFHVRHISAFRPTEDPLHCVDQIAKTCRQLKVAAIAADSGMGLTNNRLLFDQFRPPHGLYAIIYAQADKAPEKDGLLYKWKVDRTVTLGHVFTRVRKRSILFPQLTEMREFLGEFACEVATYDGALRSVKFTKAESQRDDVLHATNFALLLAVRSRGK